MREVRNVEWLGDQGASERRLGELCREIAGSHRLIVASNRGPVQYQVSEDGEPEATRGGGGVAVALGALSRHIDFTWVASVMGDGDRQTAWRADNGTLTAVVEGQRFLLRFVDLPKATYEKHYGTFCNPFLWFFQHEMWNPTHNPGLKDELRDAWENGYVPANQAFADAVSAVAGGETSPCVMLHDYHLYLAGGLVRARFPGALIHHFIHIPWPPPLRWMLLPRALSRAICESLCACDIVGLQTKRDVLKFLLTCQICLPEATVDREECVVRLNGRETRVKAYPISVDVSELWRLAESEECAAYRERLRPYTGENTIMRVDRLEPTKNILRGFQAYDLLLAGHPELHGRLKMMAFLVPSRTSLKEYHDHAEAVFRLVGEINEKYGTESWQPIKVFFEHNYPQAIAGMGLYDVLLVNAIADGMNLVAKEGPVVNTRDGVLVLSEGAGCHEQLGCGAISIAPTDVEGTARALYEALTMPLEEKRIRAQRLAARIGREDIVHWFGEQLADLRDLTERFAALPKVSVVASRAARQAAAIPPSVA